MILFQSCQVFIHSTLQMRIFLVYEYDFGITKVDTIVINDKRFGSLIGLKDRCKGEASISRFCSRDGGLGLKVGKVSH